MATLAAPASRPVSTRRTVLALPPGAKARFAYFETDRRDSDARRIAANARYEELREAHNEKSWHLAELQKHERNFGPAVKETTTWDEEKGGEVVTRTPNSAIPALKAEIEALHADMRQVQIDANKIPVSSLARIEEFVAYSGGRWVDVEPPTPQPKKSETPLTALQRIREERNDAAAEIARIQKAFRTKAEITAAAIAEIEQRAARNAPKLAGLAKGGSLDRVSGAFRVENPRAKIGWPTVEVYTPAETRVYVPDAVGIVAWLFKDQLIQRIKDQIESTYDDFDSISAADKPALLAAAEAKLLELERTEEELCLLAEAAGFNVVRRADADVRALLQIARP